ncbi:hypothetical protein OAD98_00010 [Flavobacteriales bacterium]|nr:hypothetical protein [Flavobacteriales bacterium]MDC0014928.1 hypothetical protein [Flavobacteriales bacterium]MDC1352714.1 hypothetical protein [Flavobacteriales bacterium]|tara:strand:- start:11421 stop:11882 length:462 start_codon:yes stop_codon:yes gene_type:complete
MKKKTLILLSVIVLLTSCKKEDTRLLPCEETELKLEGNYSGTVTHYPWQSSQEGDEIFFVLSTDIECKGDGTNDNIHLYDFFTSDCAEYKLFDNNSFTVTYTGRSSWSGAGIKGTGTFKDNKFHFEGFVNTTSGDQPIILDASRIEEKDTSIC